MNLEDLRDAFRRADDGYIDEDDLFYISAEGEEAYEKMKKGMAI